MDRDIIDTFIDDCGVTHHLSDFAPSDDDKLQEGQCVCGAFDCHTEYECWTSGF